MPCLPRLRLRLVDNNKGVSQAGYYLPDATPLSAALTFANTLRGVLLPLTSAALEWAELTYDLQITPSGPPAPDSNTREKLALFYSAGMNHGSILIPSPRNLAYDLGGPWRGFRLTRQAANDAELLDDIEAMVTGTVFRNNDVFPALFTVGSLEQIVP